HVRGSLNLFDNIAYLTWADQLALFLKALPGEPRPQVGIERSQANDPTTEGATTASEQPTGVDQVCEPLLHDETADRHDPRGAVLGGGIGELGEIQAVIDPLDLRCRGSVGLM